MEDLPQQFVQHFRQGTWSELACLDGGAPEPTRALERVPFLRLPGHRTARVKRLLAGAMHLVANALYVSPAVVIAAALAPPPIDGYLAAGFAALVSLFFFLLALFILWSVVHYGATRNLEPTVEPPGSADPPSLAPGSEEAVTATGVVTSLEGAPRGTPVVVDLWCTSASPAWRAVAARDFAVVAFGQPTVVVRHESAPLLLAEDEPERFGASLELLPEPLRARLVREARADLEGPLGGEARVLRVGDTVEVTAPLAREIPNLARFELGGAAVSFDPRGRGPGDPYRAGPGEPGRLARSRPERPALLRRL